MAELGQEIRRRREEKGWSQAQLAVYAGMAPSAVSQIETGRRSPNTGSLAKIAEALGAGVSDFFPKGQAPLPLEQPLTASPEVREWLEERGAKFALMSAAEFSELVLGMESGAGAGDLLDGIERLVEEITEEDLGVERALMREFARGGELFPNTLAGPDLVKRASARFKAVMALKRALADDYQVLRRSLMNYSMRLYAEGRASDFLVHPRLHKTMQRQMLEAAFAEEGAA